MKGKTLVLVERATTAGYVFPVAWFKLQGVKDINTYFSDYFFAGSHNAAIDAVLNNKADIGAAKNTIYERMRELHPQVDKELVILASSPRVFSNGLFVRKNIPEKHKEQLKNLLLNLHQDEKGVNVLLGFGAKYFVATSKEDYQPVINLAAEADIDLKKYEYYNP